MIESNHRLVLILLDVVMPVMDGYKVLEYMQERNLLNEVPVILITGETIKDSEGIAYSFGVADVIHKPFYPHIVKRRSRNIIELYQNKRNMEIRLKEQELEIRAQEKEIRETNEFMIEALSSVVESRSAETGDHTRRIRYYTRIMANCLKENFPQYGLTDVQVDEISRASVMHDIGKIGISDTILLKPGRLTSEEFEIMKTHTIIGCEMLQKLYRNRQSEFYQYCYSNGCDTFADFETTKLKYGNNSLYDNISALYLRSRTVASYLDRLGSYGFGYFNDVAKTFARVSNGQN